MRLTIFRKGLLLISLPLILQLILTAFLLRTRSDAEAAEQRASYGRMVILEANRAFALLLESHAAARGYVVTGHADFGTQSERTATEAMKALESLRAMVEDRGEQAERVAAVRERAQNLVTWLEQLRGLVEAGDQKASVEEVRRLEGKRLREEVRFELDRFLAEERRLDDLATEDLNRTRQRQAWTLGLGALTGVLVAATAVYLFAREVSSRLAVATENARRLAENTPLADPVPGQDEIAELDAAMHRTATLLTDAVAKQAAYKTALEQRAAELVQTNDSLRQQTQENEMFVYSVSHDLRSPLVNLQGFSRELLHAGEDLRRLFAQHPVPDALRDQVNDIIERDITDSVRFIQSAVTRSSGIIDALLRLSRAGRLEYRWQMVSVRGAVLRVIEAMDSSIEEKQATVAIAELADAWGDPTAIEQIFGNIIGNAINYLDPARPGRLEIGMLDEGRLDLHGLRTYYVKDNGLGIPQAYLGKVFVAFQRLHGEVAKGEGIGLALVRRAVERHGGRVWVESEDGVGTTFFIALPGGPPPEQAAAPASSAAGNGEAERDARSEPADQNIKAVSREHT